MDENASDLVQRLQREALEQLRGRPVPPVERPTVHYTELPEDTSHGPLATEWNFHRREVGRFLRDGHEGRWVLIQGHDIIGIWDTEAEADRVRLQRFVRQPALLKQIRVREPILRGGGYHRGWQR